MSSNPNYWGLFCILVLHKGSHLFCGLDAIHHWHAEIGEYHLVLMAKVSSHDQLLHSLLARDAEVYLKLCVDTCSKEHNFHCFDTEFLVVHYHDSAVLELLVALHSLVSFEDIIGFLSDLRIHKLYL